MNITPGLISFLLAFGALSPLSAGLKPGSYVKSTYIQALKKTRSPFKSIGKGGVLEIVVTESGGIVSLLPIVDFHDSGGEYRLLPGLRASRSDNLHPEKGFQIDLNSDHSFSVRTPGAFQGQYEFVGSTEDFLRATTVVGSYLDPKGRQWVFGQDGKASTPDRQFSYRVGCDHFEAQFDYLFGPDIDWAFDFHDGSLRLFNCTSQDGPSVPEATPFIVLKRQSK